MHGRPRHPPTLLGEDPPSLAAAQGGREELQHPHSPHPALSCPEIPSRSPGKHRLFVCLLTSVQLDSRTRPGKRMRPGRGMKALAGSIHTGGCRRMPQNPKGCSQNALSLRRPHRNLRGTRTPFPAPPSSHPPCSRALAAPAQRTSVNTPANRPGEEGFWPPPESRGSALTWCVAGGVSPAFPSHGCGAQGAPWPCCSPGERQRVLIEFLDYPGGEVVISLNPASGRVP